MKKTITSKIKMFLRFTVSFVAYYSGFFSLYRRCFLKDKAVILLYHRVIDQKEETIPLLDGIYVTKEIFRKHMEYLSKNYNVVPIEQLIYEIENGQKLRNDTCVVTFDDGWLDNYKYAFPILKEFNLPATIFLATGFIGKSEWFWPEKMVYLIYTIMQNADEFTNEIVKISKKWSCFLPLLDKHSMTEDQLNTIINQLKDLPTDEKDTIMQEIRTRLGIRNLPSRRLTLNWKEINEMAEHNVTFGSHTVSHCILTNLPNDEIIQELSNSMKTLHDHLHTNIIGFCYPNGNFNEKIKQLVKKTGYHYAVTTDKGLIFNRDDLYEMKRIHVHNDIAFSKPMYAFWLQGPMIFKKS